MRHSHSAFCILHSALCIAFAALCAASANADEYVYRVPISVSGYNGSTLANFPVLVRLAEDSPSGFSYADCAADGSDIRFADAHGMPIPHEIDTWDPQGESCVWVKLPSMAQGTRFEMRYGGSPSSVNTPTGVWADYIGVWHFSEISGGDALDASGHGLHAVERDGAASELAAESKVGGARLVTAANVTKTQALTVPDFIPTYGGGTVFSASGWFKFPGCTGNAYYCVIDKKRTTGAAWSAGSGWYLEMNNSPTKIALLASNGQIPTANITSIASNWHYFTVVSTGSNYRLFLDGAMVINTSNPVNASTCPMELMPCAGGIADEFRFRTTAVDADWALADYKAQTGTLLTYGSLTTANYIDVTATPEEFGPTSPAYGAINAVSGQTYAFTAPASGYNANGAKSATCTGWNLYRVNESSPFRTSSDAGETTLSCTLQYSEPVRLEWTWGNAVDHGWRYDGSGSTKLITELDPPDGGPAWIIKCTISGSNLTLTGVQQAGTNAVLNLRLPVTDANYAEYTIVAIGGSAFSGRTDLTSVRLPDTLTTIGPAAFRTCTALTNVVLSSSLTTFSQRTDGGSSGAFEGCTALRTVTPFLPDSLTSIGWATFSGCTSLEGDLRLGCGNGSFTMAAYGARSSHFESTKITSVTMGDGVTYIGSRDFLNCTALTNVVLSPYLTKIDQRTDGQASGAFQGCTALRTVTPFLPDTLTYLGWATFNGCTSLEGGLRLGCGNGPFTLAQYGNYANHFESTKITSATMGDGVKSIGSRAFFSCAALTNVVLSSHLTTFSQRGDGAQSGAFQNCTALRTVTPLLPDSVTYLGWATFANCTSLEGDLRLGCGTNALTLASYNSSGAYFQNTALDSVTLGTNALAIPPNVFSGCTSLTGIVVEAESPSLGNNVFANAKAVREVVFKGFPTWTGSTFSGWTNYQSRFTVPGLNASWIAFLTDTAKTTPWSQIEGTAAADAYYAGFGADAPQPRGYTVSSPAKQWIVTTSSDAGTQMLQITGDPGEYGEPSPAYGEHDFTEEVARGGVECAAPEYTVVGDELKECTGYTISIYDEEMLTWNDPQSGAGTNVLFRPATSGTRQLKWNFATAGYRLTVDNPATVTVASDTPFFQADGFHAAGAQVTLTVSSPTGVFRRWYGDVPAGQEGNASVTVTMDAAKAVTPYFEQGWVYDSSAKTITDGYWTLKVTVSGTEMAVTGVSVRGILPLLDLAKPVEGGAYTICFIGPAAFRGDKNLVELVLPETFREFRQRTDGQGSGAFEGCTALRTVTPFLPDSVTYLGWATFSGCTSLEGDLRLGCGNGSFTMAAYGARSSHFESTKITSVTMGDGVTYIGSRDFLNCTALTNVVLSPYLTKIDQRTDGQASGAFQGCTALRTVTPFLPDTLTYLGWATFNGCTSLEGGLRLGCGNGPFTLAQYGNYANHFESTKITSATMGDGVKSIGSRAFFSCAALTNVVLSSHLTTFSQRGDGAQSGAFQNCTALRTVTPLLPDSVTYLGWATFANCTSLEGDLRLGCGTNALTLANYNSSGYHFQNTAIGSATLGANLSSTVPNYAFSGCRALRDVYFCGHPSVTATAFANFNNYQARFFVPRDNADWADYLSDAASVKTWADLSDGVRDEYFSRFGGRKPVGLGLAAPYKNQWFARWSPLDKRTIVILR